MPFRVLLAVALDVLNEFEKVEVAVPPLLAAMAPAEVARAPPLLLFWPELSREDESLFWFELSRLD